MSNSYSTDPGAETFGLMRGQFAKVSLETHCRFAEHSQEFVEYINGRFVWIQWIWTLSMCANTPSSLYRQAGSLEDFYPEFTEVESVN